MSAPFIDVPGTSQAYETAMFTTGGELTLCVRALGFTRRVEIVRMSRDTSQSFSVDAETARALGRELIAASRTVRLQEGGAA